MEGGVGLQEINEELSLKILKWACYKFCKISI